jgi:hypothetical protein
MNFRLIFFNGTTQLKNVFRRPGIGFGLLLVFLTALVLVVDNKVLADTPYLQSQDIPAESVSPETLARGALLDTLYYNYDKWIPAFKQEISRFESRPQTLETQLRLLQYHFYLGGLLVEYSHTLVVTSKYRLQELEEDYLAYLNKAKQYAQNVIKSPDISTTQLAKAYFYLGSTEGYLGILEYGVGNYFSAFSNGLQADGHLEKALQLDPGLTDAYLGLGVYRYANSRVGGLGNLIMQWGRDLRHTGILQVEQALNAETYIMPLAFKTLIWFYISEQINPRNADLSDNHPLSITACRKRAVELLKEMESRYFKNPPNTDFIGSKDLALMKAIQSFLDKDFASAKTEFEKIVKISNYLRDKKGYKINPKLISTSEMGAEFAELILESAKEPHDPALCQRIDRQITFIENGKSIVEQNSKAVRREILNIFYNKLTELSGKMSCK